MNAKILKIEDEKNTLDEISPSDYLKEESTIKLQDALTQSQAWGVSDLLKDQLESEINEYKKIIEDEVYREELYQNRKDFLDNEETGTGTDLRNLLELIDSSNKRILMINKKLQNSRTQRRKSKQNTQQYNKSKSEIESNINVDKEKDILEQIDTLTAKKSELENNMKNLGNTKEYETQLDDLRYHRRTASGSLVEE